MLLDNLDAFKSSDLPTALSILQAMHAEATVTRLPPKGNIMTLVLLAQLSTFLPSNLRLDKYSLITIDLNSRTQSAIHNHLQASSSTPVLLLVSGIVNSRSGSWPITVGAFLPPKHATNRMSKGISHSEDSPIFFQTKPSHRVARPCAKYPKLWYSPPSNAKNQNLLLSFRIHNEKMMQAGLVFREESKAEFWIDGAYIPGSEVQREPSLEMTINGVYHEADAFWAIDVGACEIVVFQGD